MPAACSGPNQGSEILRVLHAVQHQQERRLDVEQLVEAAVDKRLGLRDDALMVRAIDHAIEAVAVEELGGDTSRAGELDQRIEAVRAAGERHAVHTAAAAQRLGNGVTAVKEIHTVSRRDARSRCRLACPRR